MARRLRRALSPPEAHGVTVMRITAADVKRNVDDVADAIVRTAVAMIEHEA
jgi:very-short-patch-repair endonuclease